MTNIKNEIDLESIISIAREYEDRSQDIEITKAQLVANMKDYGFTLADLENTWTKYRDGSIQTEEDIDKFLDLMRLNLASVKIKGKRLDDDQIDEIIEQFQQSSRDNRRMYNGTCMGTIKNEVTWMGQATSFQAKLRVMFTPPKAGRQNAVSSDSTKILNKLKEIEKILQKTKGIDSVDIPETLDIIKKLKPKFQ